VPVAQMPPGQQRSMLAPQCTHIPAPASQTKGAPQKSLPPVRDGQQGWLRPPHAWHWPLLQSLNGAVQRTMSPQQGWPILPQAMPPAPEQPPPLHVPCVVPHMPAEATH